MPLNPRAEALLRTLVERYIVEGQPVGSRTLARASGMDLSPATIRNVMADLEELGLVVSPHTSAGRVPTHKGYRVFVDTLLKVKPLTHVEVRRIRGELEVTQDPQHLIESASQMLSELCGLTGIITLPRRDDQSVFQQLDFVVLSQRRILVVLITRDGQVHNRIIVADRDYTHAELEQAANCFNETYAGIALNEIKRRLLQELQQATDEMQRIMHLAVTMAHRALEQEPEAEELVVRGESNLMDIPDLGDIRMLRRLFDAFNTKRDLLLLLDRSMRAGGVRIFIGAESGYDVLEECSVVTAPYTVEGQLVGTLGVIGPTRMPYDHIIPIVDLTARLLSGALSAGDRPGPLES